MSRVQANDIEYNAAAVKATRVNVFLFEHVAQDLKNAKEFGSIKYLFDDRRGRSGIFDCLTVQDEILRALDESGFDASVDYICITGHLVSLALLIAAVVSEYGAVRVLFFDTIQKCYIERKIGYEFQD